jgi:hypothetical protein
MRIPSHYFDAVAVFEAGHMEENQMTFEPVATATIFAYTLEDQSTAAEGEVSRMPVLVTNKHVVEGTEELYIRFNQGSGSGSERFRMDLKPDGKDLFRVSDRYDVAVTPFPATQLQEAGAHFDMIPSEAMLDMEGLEKNGIAPGEAVFTLGFPMGLAGDEKKYAIARGGIVARLDPEIVETTGELPNRLLRVPW